MNEKHLSGQGRMKIALGILLTTAIVFGGCVRSTDPTVPGPLPPATDTNGQAVEPAHNASDDPADTEPILCREGVPPTSEEMTRLLVDVSMYAPLDHLTGPALEVEKQWLDLQHDGWPEEAGTWASHIWLEMNVTLGLDQSYVVYLRHGWLHLNSTRENRFQVVCDKGGWKVRQFGYGAERAWLQPAAELPGQNGPLTPSLAAELINVAREAQGPWLAQVVTGNALAWARVDALYKARGQKPLPNLFRGGGSQGMTVIQIDELHAEGGVQPDRPTLRFVKVGGLWKIENYTEGGEWVGPPQDWRFTPAQFVLDPPFGLLLGKTDTGAIERGFGTPDSVRSTATGKTYVYGQRRLEVDLDLAGKVTSLTMRTGATDSGVKVGSPIALWELIHGTQNGASTTSGNQVTYVVRDGRIAEITYRGKKP